MPDRAQFRLAVKSDALTAGDVADALERGGLKPERFEVTRDA